MTRSAAPDDMGPADDHSGAITSVKSSLERNQEHIRATVVATCLDEVHRRRGGWEIDCIRRSTQRLGFPPNFSKVPQILEKFIADAQEITVGEIKKHAPISEDVGSKPRATAERAARRSGGRAARRYAKSGDHRHDLRCQYDTDTWFKDDAFVRTLTTKVVDAAMTAYLDAFNQALRNVKARTA